MNGLSKMKDLTRASNCMAGWVFSESDIEEAMRGNRLLNPSIDLSNPCNLNCPYCFIEEKDSERKVRYADEMSLDEILCVLHDFASAGARTVNIVGAGEPTIDPIFERVVQETTAHNMTPVVFTNGIYLGERPKLVDLLYEVGATVVLKYNSSKQNVQDLVAGRIGYSNLRDQALEALLNRGFNAYQPTRLAFDIIAFRGIVEELPSIYRECRRKNIFPIVADFIPTGRTEDGQFVGDAALRTLRTRERFEVMHILQPLEDEERDRLCRHLKRIDSEEFGLSHHSFPAYYSGAPCVQILGVYVDIHGNIWPCVAREVQMEDHFLKDRLGSIRSGDAPSGIWRNSACIKTLLRNYTGACPYKRQLDEAAFKGRCKSQSVSSDGP